jgi:hypothetical protein
MFVHPLSSYHHHHHPHHLQPRAIDLPASPSPPLRDVGSINAVTAPSQARKLPQPPLPFPKGCGRLTVVRQRLPANRRDSGRMNKTTRRWANERDGDGVRMILFLYILTNTGRCADRPESLRFGKSERTSGCPAFPIITHSPPRVYCLCGVHFILDVLK